MFSLDNQTLSAVAVLLNGSSFRVHAVANVSRCKTGSKGQEVRVLSFRAGFNVASDFCLCGQLKGAGKGRPRGEGRGETCGVKETILRTMSTKKKLKTIKKNTF